MERISPFEAMERLADVYGVADPRDAAEEVVHALGKPGATVPRDEAEAQVLDGLAVLELARGHLDTVEAQLLRLGRDQLRITFARLAPALGVKTAQAAEQRCLRKTTRTTGNDLSAVRAKARAQRAAAAADQTEPAAQPLTGDALDALIALRHQAADADNLAEALRLDAEIAKHSNDQRPLVTANDTWLPITCQRCQSWTDASHQSHRD